MGLKTGLWGIVGLGTDLWGTNDLAVGTGKGLEAGAGRGLEVGAGTGLVWNVDGGVVPNRSVGIILKNPLPNKRNICLWSFVVKKELSFGSVTF